MDCTDLTTPTSLSCIQFFLGNILDKALIFASIAAVFFVSFAGIKFLTSGGDPIRVERAKKTLTYAVVGLLIILLSFTIVKVVSKVTSVDCKILGIGGCK